MIELGKRQDLVIVKQVEFGVYLAENEDGGKEQERVLLPKKEVPEEAQLGNVLSVFTGIPRTV